MADRPRVFTIPASAPFLKTLIEALQDDRMKLGFKPSGDPLALASATIYLPTRRACRLVRERYLEIAGGDAAILPRLVSLNDVDADELMFAEAAAAEPGIGLPDALDGFERNALLGRLIRAWAERIAPGDRQQASLVATSPQAAFALAQDLARLMDDMTTRQVDWSSLDRLVPEEFDDYWKHTLQFLNLIHEPWREHLKTTGRIEPAARRDLLIEAEAKRLARHTGPVIAAGSTGSMPSTARLLETIARLPRGAVVLPGLDTDLDEATWAMIASRDGEAEHSHGHPQFAMHALIERIGVARGEIEALAPPAPHGRELLLSEALRPAAASELWQERLQKPAFAAHAAKAMDSIAIVEAGNAEEEALAIAVALREAMETPGKTAALVTPDRALARRVVAALARWNVPVDDSGGDALPDTPGGVFARLVAEAAIEGLPPVTLLALLKHELCTLDHAATAVVERAVLRGPRPRAGTAGLADALAAFRQEHAKFHRKEASALHRSNPATLLTGAELDAAGELAAKLRAALEPLETLPRGPRPLKDIADRHDRALRALGGMTGEVEAGLDAFATADSFDIEPSDYPAMFRIAMADRMVRRRERNVRVRVFGPLESRLQSVDRIVLGGLIEGVWPPETRADPWLSRPMRQTLGLDLPERRIGLSAHDFAQALGAPEVFLTRAARQGGAPTVPSRFMQRLAAVAGESRWKTALERGARYPALARTLDETAGQQQPAKRPEPAPPFEARPRQLSVTEIEDWLRDPYTIYARHVLRLAPLDEIDTAPGAADRGTVIHESIGDFTKAYPGALPADPVRELTAIGQRHFAPLSDYPEARAFWWPRFERIAAWFADFERERRGKVKTLFAEVGGRISIPFGDREFRLTVRADRIECLADGRYAILDYKTGAPPTDKQVRTGMSPQLPLEAAILREGGFSDIPKGGSVAEVVYVRLSGGAEAGEQHIVPFKDETPDINADAALEKLARLVARFADPKEPYASLLHPMWSTHYGTYDHLARVQEWSQTGGASDDGAGE